MQFSSLIPALTKLNVPDFFSTLPLVVQATGDRSLEQVLQVLSSIASALEWSLIGQGIYLLANRRLVEGLRSILEAFLPPFAIPLVKFVRRWIPGLTAWRYRAKQCANAPEAAQIQRHIRPHPATKPAGRGSDPHRVFPFRHSCALRRSCRIRHD